MAQEENSIDGAVCRNSRNCMPLYRGTMTSFPSFSSATPSMSTSTAGRYTYLPYTVDYGIWKEAGRSFLVIATSPCHIFVRASDCSKQERQAGPMTRMNRFKDPTCGVHVFVHVSKVRNCLVPGRQPDHAALSF